MSATEETERQSEGGAETTEMTAPENTTISLPYELATLHGAIEGARILADLVRADALPDEEETLRALIGLSDVLSLVGCRVDLLARAAGGFADPLLLAAPHNEALPGDEDQGELRLRPWSLRRRRRQLREDLERVRAQLRGQRQRAGP